jgi:hypothetical protein
MGIMTIGAASRHSIQVRFAEVRIFQIMTVSAKFGLIFDERCAVLSEMRKVAIQARASGHDFMRPLPVHHVAQPGMTSQTQAGTFAAQEVGAYRAVAFVAVVARVQVGSRMHIRGSVVFQDITVAANANETRRHLQIGREIGAVRIVTLPASGIGIRFVDFTFGIGR